MARANQKGRGNREREESEFSDKLVSINRVAKVIKGGRRFGFRTVMVVGDNRGSVGVGVGRAQTVPDALRKASDKARKSMRKIPMVGTLFAAGDLIRILNEPGDVKSKVDDIAGLLGGLGGATLGTIAGGTIGSVVPLAGTAIGGLVGGIGGYFLGDMVAQGLAQWLLGQKVDAFPGMINDMINGKEPPDNPVPAPLGTTLILS